MILVRVLLSVLLLICIFFLFPFTEVVGTSMFPTYSDGEILFSRRIFLKSLLKVGNVVVFHSPEDEKKILIKRIAEKHISENKVYYYCLGDNSNNSRDSRHFGYVSSDLIICRPFIQRRNKHNDGK